MDDSSDEEDHEGLFNPDMFATNVDTDLKCFSFDSELEGEKVEIKLHHVHSENQFIETFVSQVIWPSAVAMSEYFVMSGSKLNFASSNIIELGSGTGLCGLTIAKLCKTIVLTDYKDNSISLLQDNIALNNLSNCSTYKLTWGNQVQATELITSFGLFDYCIGTDVVYEPESVPPLFQTAHMLLKPDGVFFLANHTHRYAGLEHIVVAEAAKMKFVETKLPCIITPDDGQIDISMFKKI